MAAEGPLHELGAIAIVNSDSQGMGRIMETVRRTIQLAHVMKRWRATEAGRVIRGCRPIRRPARRHERVLRYLAKVTIEPAITHGISAARRLAASRAGSPTSCSGSRPGSASSRSSCSRAGYPAWAPLGEGNATVERAEPTRYRRGLGRDAAGGGAGSA